MRFAGESGSRPAAAAVDSAGSTRTSPAGALWLRATLGAALVLTALECFILQEKRSFFTGGFLAAEHVTSPWEGAAFLGASVVVDAAFAGVLALLALWATAPVRLTRFARGAVVLASASVPLLIVTIVSYSLLAYLGDAFDLGLMFELTGHRPAEIFAVASAHLGLPMVLGMAAAAILGAGVWTLNRIGQTSARARVEVPRRLAGRAAALFATGVVVTTVASGVNDTLEDGLRRKASGNTVVRLAAWLTDFDGDGYGMVGRTRDPAPFNAAIYPYALDIPGNGIDENGVGGDLPSAEPAYREGDAAALAWRRHPDVVLIVLESFRADALGRTVNGVPVTPVLDALAREGASSSRAFSHNGYTAQSRYHLMTGSLAGLRDGSLIDDFAANGYQTAYFSGQDESFGGPAFGIGFERAEVRYDAREDPDRRYSRFTTAGSLAVPHTVLQEKIDAFLEARTDERPLFLYVNFHDTHFPYHHDDLAPLVSDVTVRQSRIAPRRAEAVREMYFNAAANVDRALGHAIETVTRALGRTPAIVVTADHGESLFDEGFLGHGYALNDVQTRIPLIVRGLPMEIGEPFGQVELRDAIGAALSRDPADGDDPRLVPVPGKEVFQYLGNIHRPRQIAFADGGGRVIYDFRSRLVHLPGGAVQRASGLDDDDSVPFLRLVHYWERMMLARAAGGAATEE